MCFSIGRWDTVGHGGTGRDRARHARSLHARGNGGAGGQGAVRLLGAQQDMKLVEIWEMGNHVHNQESGDMTGKYRGSRLG